MRLMSIVLPDWYAHNTFGSMEMKTMQTSNRGYHIQRSGIKKTIGVNVIIDRDFRDVLELLTNYEIHISSYLRRGSHNTKTLKTKLTADVIYSIFTTVLRHMFKDHLNSNHFNPIVGDLVTSVTACKNDVRGPIYKPIPQWG